MKQEFDYIAQDSEGYSTVKLNQEEALISTYVYRKVKADHNLTPPPKDQVFIDRTFDLKSLNITQQNGMKYVLMPLHNITKGELFKQEKYSTVDEKADEEINFFKQIQLLPIHYYKSLFTSRNVSPKGFYEIILNINGVFKYVCIDDLILTSDNKTSSIYGVKLRFPWQILLLKAYAKSIGGYDKLRNTQPFSFIKAVTFNNWRIKKFDSLDTKTHLQFLQHKLEGDITPNYLQQSNINVAPVTVESIITDSAHYNQSNKENPPFTSFPPKTQNSLAMSNYYGKSEEPIVCSTKHSFTIISKTKNNYQIYDYGLQPNSYCYRLSNIFELDGQHVIKVQSSNKSKWNGKFSIYDPSFNKFYSERKHRLTLDKNFLMSLNDFRELFSTSMVSPIDYQIPLTSNYTFQNITLPQNCSHAQYFQFQIVQPGKYDFSIVQSESNMIDQNQQIHSFSTLRNSKKVYPKVKILIGRRNQLKNQTSSDSEELWSCVDAAFDSEGLQNLQTHFQNLIVGRYMIRIKIQKCQKPLSYTLDLVSDSPVKMYWVDPPKKQRSLFQRSCLQTLAREKGDIFYLDSQTCQEWVSYGNAYKQIGYSFIGFCAEQRSPYKLYCQVNQQSLYRQGFTIKYPYKNNGKQIGIFSQNGNGKVLILKSQFQPTVWPPSSLRFFKVEV